jgi:hypothetical protein
VDYTHGADIDEVERIARALKAQARHLDDAQSAVTQALGRLEGSWDGPDLVRAQGRWRAVRQGLVEAAAGVRARGEDLRREAEEQRRASSSAGQELPIPPTPRWTPDTEPPIPSPTGPGGTPPVPSPLDETTLRDEGGPEIPFVPGRFLTPTEQLVTSMDGAPSWTPQGLAYLADGNLLITTMYDSESEGSSSGLLALQDKDSGEVVGDVRLGGIDHYGGVAADGDHVWVSGGGKVQLYSLQELLDAESGSTVDPRASFDVKASSTLTYADGHLFVADFTSDAEEPGKVYSYPVDSLGRPADVPDHEWTGPRGEIQGIAVDDHHIYLSHSEGRFNESYLSRMPRDPASGLPTETVEAGHTMAEGIALVDGSLLTTYESGANTYAGSGSDPEGEVSVRDLD